MIRFATFNHALLTSSPGGNQVDGQPPFEMTPVHSRGASRADRDSLSLDQTNVVFDVCFQIGSIFATLK